MATRGRVGEGRRREMAKGESGSEAVVGGTVNTLPGGRDVDRRDTYMDTLRVVSLGVVIAYHWLGLLPQLRAGVYTDRPITEAVPGLWPLTWLIDVIPLFFFVGGFANARSYDAVRRRGGTAWQFLSLRYRRILVPTVVFMVACTVLLLVVGWVGELFGPRLQLLSFRNTAPFGQLWFVGIYIVEISLVPLTLRAHRRFGEAALVAIVVAAAATDLLSWALGSNVPLLLNIALVWMVPHQLGYFYADGRLEGQPPWRWAVLALAGLAGLAVLTSLPYYARDLLDPHRRVLTVQALTFPLVVQSLFIVGVAMLVRPALVRSLHRRAGFRHGIERTNRSIMSLFLWHTTSFLLAVLVLSGVPGVLSYDPTATWWEARPVVLLGSAGVLALMFAGAAGLRHATDRVPPGPARALLRWNSVGLERRPPPRPHDGRR